MRSYLFLFTLSFYDNFSFSSIVICINFFYRFLYLFDDIIANFIVKYFQMVLIWKDKSQWYTQIRIFRNFREQGQFDGILNINNIYLDAELFHHHFCVAFTKNFIFSSTLAALIVSHVLDNPQNRYSKVLEHLNSFNHVNECQSLGCRHDDSPVEFYLLAKTQLHITSPWRHIYDQIIKLSPPGFVQELGKYF